ncbi:MAG TPA: M3 family peptidase, partial [Saprospiraceae bacterium]|nr:M3 family peptidase [Saprospiraceae bacterium]
NTKDQDILRNIDKRLAQLKLQFSENVLAETQAFKLHLTHKTELKGIPENAIEEARNKAKQANVKGWIFTLDYPSYHAVITYSENRKIREKIARAYGKRGFQKNEHNNEKIILEIAQLRYQRAQLLGYSNHAEFVLEERMAKTPKKVTLFLENLLEKAIPAAKKEYSMLTAYAKKQGIDTLQLWDGPYLIEKLRKERFNLDDELLKPYFKLENVIAGAFKIAQKLYGLQFKKTKAIDRYHPDVNTYEVIDKHNNHIAILYTDFFPRKGKRNGAWMTSYKNQWIKNGSNSRPHISMVCNFTKPTADKPSLLTFREVTTLFHEFGHALHGMLANTTYPSLSGTSVYWDFVELPSQLLENWAYEEEALALFAKHYQTHALLPIELVNRIKESSNFMEGMATLRQLSFGFLDMAWHGENPTPITDVKTLEKQAFNKTQLYPEIEDGCMSTAFSHIFSGGDASGYYSYKWAEVLDADAFELFRQNGILDKKTADNFKKYILSQGGTDEPMNLYKQFRGAEPDINALLRRAGLI